MHEFLRYVQLYTECDDAVLKRLEPLLNKYITPKVVVKEKRVEVIRYHKFNTQPQRPLISFFNEYKKQSNVSLDDITKRCRTIETRTIRNAFIRSAIERGYTASAIARFLNMNHTSILNVIKKSKV
jgi:hypothetical protein